MEWIQSILNAENGSAVQLLAITICIVILLILITWIFRKIAGTAARRNARNRIPRLSVTDWTSVGEKHQLVLVRRDNVEHLLLIGGNSDVVVENNIVRVQSAAKPRTDTTIASPTPKPEIVEEEKAVDVVTPIVATTAATAAVATEADTTETAPASADVETEVAEAATQVTEEIAVEVEAPATETVEPETPVTETAEFENGLIASISETLDEEIKPEATQPTVETPVAAPEPATTEKGEDEMQRLLDELASETKDAATKEPA